MLPIVIIPHIIAFALGLGIVIGTLGSAIKTVVLPRAAQSRLTRLVFNQIRLIFTLRLSHTDDYEEIDRVMAIYAPTGLLTLPAAWVTMVALGYTGMFWAMGAPTWHDAFTSSGSSLLTLGFRTPTDMPTTILTFTEATIGLLIVALLISYLPTMYTAFARREATVSKLAIRAGSPPSAARIIAMHHRLGEMPRLSTLWEEWETWYIEVEESHTSLPALNFFRSPQPQRHWVLAAALVLDAASLLVAAVDDVRNPQAELCIRAGFMALRSIAGYFGVKFNPDPHFPSDGISISRFQFEVAYRELAEAGVPLKPDRDAAWLAFAGWRVNYDSVLLDLARIMLAPDAPWLPATFAHGHRVPLTRLA